VRLFIGLIPFSRSGGEAVYWTYPLFEVLDLSPFRGLVLGEQTMFIGLIPFSRSYSLGARRIMIDSGTCGALLLAITAIT
jgi:hypothetical protein